MSQNFQLKSPAGSKRSHQLCNESSSRIPSLIMGPIVNGDSQWEKFSLETQLKAYRSYWTIFEHSFVAIQHLN